MQDMKKTIERINELKGLHNAVILAHNYERGEIQDIADFTGDSLGLSQQAMQQEADVIVFCGVHFMAESAAILSPHKTVLLPELYAGCPMASMVTASALRKEKKKHPHAAVVCYVNSTAEVKAESDICCTSANAVEVVNSLEEEEVLFVPDRNLADYVACNTSKRIIPWSGYCPTHNQILVSDIIGAKEEHPGAEVLSHPECRREVLELSDRVFSTTGMLDHVSRSPAEEFIIATEKGILHKLEQDNPGKRFYFASEFAVCPEMKAIDIEALMFSLERRQHVISVPEDIRVKARRALDRMLAVKRNR
ncbi:quinolinate synthase NadA [Methanolobus chelungpuianus]|uniref:Quinolinate synthase n=1 Tax=Methanolobus chelungpuianus TaxID=502115 RepID=A0AAE3H8J0_9EURY|nr:quinolinate synthase NadA [Methanolobus chelungpuianus]MCQ6961936.1 quinolinate synthetase [Methanolobus chelungpuianus]